MKRQRILLGLFPLFLLFSLTTHLLAQTEFLQPPQYAAGLGPTGEAVGDFNGDGKPDLALADFSGNTVSVLINRGNGTFKPYVAYASQPAPKAIAVGDFNGDGKLDLAVTNAMSEKG